MLLQRIVTAVVLVAGLLLLAVAATPFVFALAVAIITLLSGMEWTRFIGLQSMQSRVGYIASLAILLAGTFFLVGATPTALALDPLRVITLMIFGCIFWLLAAWLMRGFPENSHLWNDQSHIALMGVFVLLPTWCGIVQLKYVDSSGGLLLGLIATVSVADIGAYFTGRAWGNKKLAPNLSPAKSWAGFWGGMASSVFLVVMILIITNGWLFTLNIAQAILLVLSAMLVCVSSVIGDLFESMLKRNRQLKDSGKLLPGHGGILDRLDSLTASTPIAVILLFLVIALGSQS